jgi:hypothetical protein
VASLLCCLSVAIFIEKLLKTAYLFLRDSSFCDRLYMDFCAYFWTQKLFTLTAVLAHDTLFFDFGYEAIVNVEF